MVATANIVFCSLHSLFLVGLHSLQWVWPVLCMVHHSVLIPGIISMGSHQDHNMVSGFTFMIFIICFNQLISTVDVDVSYLGTVAVIA